MPGSWPIFVVMDRSSSTRQRHAAGAHSGSRRARLSVDLRAHGPVLEALASSRRLPLTAVVRTALSEWLASQVAAGGAPSPDVAPLACAAPGVAGGLTKVTLRLPAASARVLARSARAAEVSQGLLVARLLEGQPQLQFSADLKEARRALLGSTAMLAALCSDLQALERRLGQDRSVDLVACQAVLAPLPAEVRGHLASASALMAALAPSRRSSAHSPGVA